ncbi:hypothetical protein [Gellertiella hungarica]|uniref:Uncharacterized protein n=1 Tax=Gellertiella hungarica TaxID=1572859 RepID=A0A7W6J7U4_9HYPH|nr:hypothetical protein [Gellertiella hungarica]MBB4065478.1 hypothetical protein [Gellertiella hungarica]
MEEDPEWVEVLGRPPMAVTEHTDETVLAGEMAERLDALLRAHNGLEPNAEGWRQLALELALKHEPLFKIETPVDRDSVGGRPVGMGNFILRSRMKSEMRQAKTQSEAARTIERQSKGEISKKTALNSLSRKAPVADEIRRLPFEWKAERAIQMAARKLSRE